MQSPEAGMQSSIEKIAASQAHNIRNVLIMIDGEGNLSAEDEAEPPTKKLWKTTKDGLMLLQLWSCHSIRVNLHGSSDAETWIKLRCLAWKTRILCPRKTLMSL